MDPFTCFGIINAQNLTPLYGFGVILGVFFRYDRLCFSGGILYRQPFKSHCLSLPGNKKAPYCYDAFVLLHLRSKGTLFNYLLYFFFLLTTVVPMAAPPLINSRAIHSKRLECLRSSLCSRTLLFGCIVRGDIGGCTPMG